MGEGTNYIPEILIMINTSLFLVSIHLRCNHLDLDMEECQQFININYEILPMMKVK